MKRTNIPESMEEMAILCGTVRQLVEQGSYEECESMLRDAMGKYPHAPEPHNLLGLLLEMQGDHLTAMKHFRAAYALDPAYIPSRHNLDRFGSFSPDGEWAYDESDCLREAKRDVYKIEYDARGVGHMVRRD